MNSTGLGIVADEEPRHPSDWDGIAADIAKATGSRPHEVEVFAMKLDSNGATISIRFRAPWTVEL